MCWPENLLGLTQDEEDKAAPAISRRGMSELDPATSVAGKTVVKADPSGKSEIDPKDASKHRYGQFVTRWGADPIRLSGALDAVMSADRFANFNEKVTRDGLRRALTEYLAHYHAERNHQGKANVLLFPEPSR